MAAQYNYLDTRKKYTPGGVNVPIYQPKTTSYVSPPPTYSTTKKSGTGDTSYQPIAPSYKDDLESELSDIREKYGSLMKGISGGGGVSAQRINLDEAINALRGTAESKKALVREKESTARQTLLDYITKIQDQSAREKQRQIEQYGKTRSDIEEQSFMSQRAAASGASSRGLGGSGLQQLAQLQSQIAAGKETSEAAAKNTELQQELAKQLEAAQKEYTTQKLASERGEAAQLADIESELGQQISATRLAEAQRYEQARMQAQAASASAAAQASAQRMNLALAQMQSEAELKLQNKQQKQLYEAGTGDFYKALQNITKTDKKGKIIINNTNAQKIYDNYLGEIAEYKFTNPQLYSTMVDSYNQLFKNFTGKLPTVSQALFPTSLKDIYGFTSNTTSLGGKSSKSPSVGVSPSYMPGYGLSNLSYYR